MTERNAVTPTEAFVLRSPAFAELGGYVIGGKVLQTDDASFGQLLRALGRPLRRADAAPEWQEWIDELHALELVYRVRPALEVVRLDATDAERGVITAAWQHTWAAEGTPTRLVVLGSIGSPRWAQTLARVVAQAEPTLTISYEDEGAWLGPHLLGRQGGCPRCLLHRRLVRDATSIEAHAPTWRALTLAVTALGNHLERRLAGTESVAWWVSEFSADAHELLRSRACPDCFQPSEATAERAAAFSERTREALALADGPEPFIDPDPRWLTYGPLAAMSPGMASTEGAFRDEELEMAGVFAVAIDGDARVVVQQPNAAYGGGFTRARRRRVLYSEAIERLALIGMRLDVARRTAASLGPLALPLAEVIPPHADGSGAPSVDTPADWTWVTSLRTGEAKLAPFDVMVAGRPARAGSTRLTDEPFFTGGATHVSARKAATHALFEVIERDAFMTAWYLRLPLRPLERRELGGDAEDARAWMERRGVRLSWFDLAVDLPVPTVLTVATVDRQVGAWVPGGVVMSGCAASTVTHAMVRGVAEVLGQFTVQACSTGTTVEDDRAAWQSTFQRYLTQDASRALAFLGASAAPPVASTDFGPGEPLDVLLGLCRERTLDPHLTVIMTDEAQRLGLWPVKVLIPGMLRPTPTRASMRFPRQRLEQIAARWRVPFALNPDDHPQA